LSASSAGAGKPTFTAALNVAISSALSFAEIRLAKRTPSGASTSLVAIAVRPAAADDRSVCYDWTNNEAIAACSRLLALNPRDAIAYNGGGNAYLYKDDFDRAISDYDQATRLYPTLTEARQGRDRAEAALTALANPNAKPAAVAATLPVKRALIIGIDAYPSLGSGLCGRLCRGVS
jgi:tetratricopeptide (TPR) repeat protein